ncbi:glycosyltransferase 87 family protein [Streptomyces sp. NPDC001678]|uniref:glycosyltransferase 87 family protein n=1 Tax=Streptomyces sp. NPDC001678 TaxID=3364599 RepID=UPI0036B506D4
MTVVPRLAAFRTAHRETAVAAAVQLAVAAVGFAVLLLVNHHLGHGARWLLYRWDSGNYLRIAERGYPRLIPHRPDGTPDYSRLAFFPLVPALIRGLHVVTGLPPDCAGVLISWCAAAVAGAGVYTLVRHCGGSRGAGYACVALWSCSPYAFALWVPYSEAVFSALLMWALVALVRRRWVTAGVLCALAGAVRPTATVLIATVLLAAGGAVLRRRDGVRPWAALALAPLGLLGGWLYLGSRVGRWDGWFEAERAWGQTFDFGAGTADFLREVLLYRDPRAVTDVRHAAVVAVVLLTAAAVVALALDRRVPWPLVVAVAGAWLLMVGTPGSPYSKPRFMLPFLPVPLLLAARPLARVPLGVRVCLYGGGAVVSGWYAAGLLVLFDGSP